MSKHHNNSHNPCERFNHTNGFVDMNGVPYLLAEYLDKEGFSQIDRSAIRSDIFVDTSDAMRAVIDISIDDIGRRCSDKYLNITGNNTKQKRLLDMIEKHKDYFAHQLPVLRKGIVVRINYRLEKAVNNQVIRSMHEDIRITDRNYFLDINPRDIEDNGIICNFDHTAVSTINEFTHGINRMILRVTSVELFYEYVKNGHKGPHIKQTTAYQDYPNGMFYDQMDPYTYHQQFQHQQFIGEPDDYCCEKPEKLIPPSWNSFNRFYHFDDQNRDIILHLQEIYDRNVPTALLPCGRCNINRSFMINPGHRLIFKLSIWKNDVTAVSNTRKIAKALDVPALYQHYHGQHHDHCNDDHEDLKDMIREILNENREEDMKQNMLIQKLMDEIAELKYNRHPGHHHNHNHDHCDHDDRLDEIEQMLQDIINGKDDEEDNDSCCNHEHTTFSAIDIRNIINEIKNE